MVEPGQGARSVVEVAAEKQASDILLLDLRALGAFTDYFVILSAETSRQITTLAEEIERALGALGEPLLRREGTPESGWVLLDFGGFVVHVFAPAERAYYQLERLWARAHPLVRVQ